MQLGEKIHLTWTLFHKMKSCMLYPYFILICKYPELLKKNKDFKTSNINILYYTLECKTLI